MRISWIVAIGFAVLSGLASAQPREPWVPITIAASQVGRFAKGHSWYLSVNSAGQAELTIATYPNVTRKQFFVSPEQLVALQQVLVEQRYFELEGKYGQIVPDGSTTTLAITVGEQTRVVKLHFLMNWVQNEPEKLRDPARALRVMSIIRGWFEFEEAVDLRPYDQRVIDAAKP